MVGRVDVTARIAAICYTLFIAALVWFTLAWGGLDEPWQLSDLLVLTALALSPIPVCFICFRRSA